MTCVKKNTSIDWTEEIFGLPKEFYKEMWFKYGPYGVATALLIAGISKYGKKKENDENN